MSPWLLALGLAAAFNGFFLWYRPEPASLRETRASKPVGERLRPIMTTLVLGNLLIFIQALVGGSSGLELEELAQLVLGLSRHSLEKHSWVPILGHGFVHFDVLHLGANLSGLGLTSAYNRKAGNARFVAVFFTGWAFGLVASLLWMPDDQVSLGASAGICATAAAYIMDQDWPNRKAWFAAVAGVFLFFAVLALVPGPATHLTYQVDHLAHSAGLLGGIAYCKVITRTQTVPV